MLTKAELEVIKEDWKKTENGHAENCTLITTYGDLDCDCGVSNIEEALTRKIPELLETIGKMGGILETLIDTRLSGMGNPKDICSHIFWQWDYDYAKILVKHYKGGKR